MADWQERVQSMIIGFVFAYMVMKLFSVISSFRAGNLRVARASDEEEESPLVPSEVVELASGDEQAGPLVATDEETEADGGDEQEVHGSSSSSDSEAEDDAAPASLSREIDSAVEPTVSGVESNGEDVETKDEEAEFKKDYGVEGFEKAESKDIGVSGEHSLKALELMNLENDGDRSLDMRDSEEAVGDFDDEFEDENEINDWEGVESTELEKLFGAASTYADTMNASAGMNPSSEAMFELHAFYKIATEGPCSTSQPSAFQPTARAKWNAWQKLGSMPQEEAMRKYIAVLTKINTSWYEDYQKSKARTEEAAEQKYGNSSQLSDKRDVLLVLSELATSGEGKEADTEEQGSAT